MLKNILKTLREANGLTKKQAASGIGITDRAYIAYEYGERDVSTDTLVKIAEFYGVTADYLLGRDADAADPLNQLQINGQDKAIIQAYINLAPAERTALVEIIKKIAEGAELEVGVNDGIEKTVYKAKRAARDGTPPSTEPMTQAEFDEIESLPDADPDL